MMMRERIAEVLRLADEAARDFNVCFYRHSEPRRLMLINANKHELNVTSGNTMRYYRCPRTAVSRCNADSQPPRHE